jgi:hypothetical protein
MGARRTIAAHGVTNAEAAALAERAEDATASVRRPASAMELQTDEYVLWHFANPNPVMGQATRLRLAAGDVERRIVEVRAWFAGLGRSRFSWAVGRHATPSDLASRLERAGARPADDSPLAVMVLVEEPPEVPGIVVRAVQTFEEFGIQLAIRFEAFASREDERSAIRARGDRPWREFRATRNSIHLAYVDGEPAAAAVIGYTTRGLALLLGGGTLERFRGRGAYRALVRSRCEEAAERGIRDVVAHARPMSRSILERVGFQTVSHIDRLEDDTQSPGGGPQPHGSPKGRKE